MICTLATIRVESQDECGLMYRLIDYLVDLSRIDRGSSIMWNSQKSCGSRMGMKRGTISSTLDQKGTLDVKYNDVVTMYSILRIICPGVKPDT